VRALLAQLKAYEGDTWGNARRAAEVIDQDRGADLAVFPELFLSGYSLRTAHQAALRPDGAELRLVADAARRAGTAAVVGFVEAVDGGVANAVACIDRDGAMRGVYRKTQLFGHEREVFVPGNDLLIAQLAGRRVGVLICFDVEFPEPARQLAMSGADLLVTASANMEPYYNDHELATRARALDNRTPHLYANLVGTAGRLRFVGGSRSIGPDGVVLVEARHPREEVLVAPVAGRPIDDDVNYLEHVREELPVLGQHASRPDPPMRSSCSGSTSPQHQRQG
jgi:predicted amidohydrolase